MQQEDRSGGSGSGPETMVSPTGDPRVDEVLAALDRLAGLPVPDHAAVLLEVHERLGGVLNPEQAIRQGGAHGAP
jgi:hypothetical protein